MDPFDVITYNGDLVELTSQVNRDNINEYNDFQKGTLLQWACLHDRYNCALYLISIGADVNQPDHDGWTPLHSASCDDNDVILLKALLDNGASIDAQANDGVTPLYCTLEDIRIGRNAYILLDRGARIENVILDEYMKSIPDWFLKLDASRKTRQRECLWIIACRSKSAWLCHDVMCTIAKHLWSMRLK